MKRKGFPESVTIRAAQAKALVRDGTAERDEPLSKALMAHVYRLPDGRAIVRFGDGRCREYASHADLARWYAAADAGARRGFNWNTLLPMGASFPSVVPDLVEQLPVILGLSKGSSGSPVDLPRVEGAVRHVGRGAALTPGIFPALLAFVGEAIRMRVGGHWRCEDRGHGYEPYLLYEDGRECQVLRLYKQILEFDDRVSLLAFVEQEVASYGGSKRINDA
jgi:hypothetical protein